MATAATTSINPTITIFSMKNLLLLPLIGLNSLMKLFFFLPAHNKGVILNCLKFLLLLHHSLHIFFHSIFLFIFLFRLPLTTNLYLISYYYCFFIYFFLLIFLKMNDSSFSGLIYLYLIIFLLILTTGLTLNSSLLTHVSIVIAITAAATTHAKTKTTIAIIAKINYLISNCLLINF